MRLAKKLACLALAGVIALAQVPVTALAEESSSLIVEPTKSSPYELDEEIYGAELFTVKWADDEAAGSWEYYKFESSNTGVASVDSDGWVITPKGEGQATITAYAKGTLSELSHKGTGKLTVKVTKGSTGTGGTGTGGSGTGGSTDTGTRKTKQDHRVLKINKSPIKLQVGDELEAKDYLYYDGSIIDEKELSYDAGDGSIASVDENGVIKAIKKGNAKFTVSAPAFEDETDEATKSILYYTTSLITVTEKESSGGSSDDSSSDDSSSGGGSSSGSSSGSGAGSGSAQSPSGATLASNTTTAADGTQVTTTTVSLGGKTMTVVDQVKQLENGATQRTYAVSGDVSGLTFLRSRNSFRRRSYTYYT